MDYNNVDGTTRCTLVLTGNGHGNGASLYHLGSLWCLNELGWLGRTERVISASGGALVAAFLGLRWHALEFNDKGIAINFAELIARPILDAFDHLSRPGDDTPIAGSAGPKQLKELCVSLLGHASLADLPVPEAGPEFAFYSRSYPADHHVRIGRNGLTEAGLGHLRAPHLPLSFAVLAASAHAPEFVPERLDFDTAMWSPFPDVDQFHESRYRSSMLLTGGCLCESDKLDILPAIEGQTFVSDAGGKYGFMSSRPARERRKHEQAPPPPVPPAEYADRRGLRTLAETLRAYWSMAEELQPADKEADDSAIIVPELLSSLLRDKSSVADEKLVSKGYSTASKAMGHRKQTLH